MCRPLCVFVPPAKARRGAAIVEFALILPLMLLLLAGIFEFGRAFWYYDALVKATRDAAREMSVAPLASVGTTTGRAKDDVVTAAAGAGVPAFTSANVQVVCLDASISTESACVDGTRPGAVTVRIINYSINIGQVIPFVVGSSSYLTSLAPHTTMRYMP